MCPMENKYKRLKKNSRKLNIYKQSRIFFNNNFILCTIRIY